MGASIAVEFFAVGRRAAGRLFHECEIGRGIVGGSGRFGLGRGRFVNTLPGVERECADDDA
jgi:hypothetical protein